MAPMAYHKATLCDRCVVIFSSHWVQRESLLSQSKDSAVANARDDGLSCHKRQSPDWVTLVNPEDDSCSEFTSPVHHSVSNLKLSADSGCHLCVLIWRLICETPEKRTDPNGSENHRLIGFTVVCPPIKYPLKNGLMWVKIWYFLDGKIGTSAPHLWVNLYLKLWTPAGNVHALQNMSLKERTATQAVYHKALDRCLPQVKSWISMCDANHRHKDCRIQSKGQRLPTRLLRVRGQQQSPSVTLYETAHGSSDIKYATLIHFWCGSQPKKLLTDNYAQLLTGIEIQDLSKTFRDAFALCLALDIEYIWIDSLCIIQDSKKDWLQEVSLITSICENSYINLAAPSAPDSFQGLFHDDQLGDLLFMDAKRDGLPRDSYICDKENAFEIEIEDSNLNERTWDLQERFLPPRLVQFARDQIWWSCHTAVPICEEYPTSAGSVILGPTISVHNRSCLPASDIRLLNDEAWMYLVTGYSKGQLTYGSDKVVAFAGIAREASEARRLPESDYLAGLCTEALPEGLLWYIIGDDGGRRPQAYRAPSWSWATVEGIVHMSHSRSAFHQCVAVLLDASSTLEGPSSGGVSAGRLQLSSPIFQIELRHLLGERSGHPIFASLWIAGKTVYSFKLRLDQLPSYQWRSVPNFSASLNLRFACIRAGAVSALEGKKADDCDGRVEYYMEGLTLVRFSDQKDEYVRVGWLRIDKINLPDDIIERRRITYTLH